MWACSVLIVPQKEVLHNIFKAFIDACFGKQKSSKFPSYPKQECAISVPWYVFSRVDIARIVHISVDVIVYSYRIGFARTSV